jgi:hypothetical protein
MDEEINRLIAGIEYYDGLAYAVKHLPRPSLDAYCNYRRSWKEIFEQHRYGLRRIGNKMQESAGLESALTSVETPFKDRVLAHLSILYLDLKENAEQLLKENRWGRIVPVMETLARDSLEKYDKAKKRIEDKELLRNVNIYDAKQYIAKHQEEIKKTYEGDSPSNREKLATAAKKLVSAGDHNTAQDYFERAGPYVYELGARVFEEAGEPERAKHFWTLAAQKPMDYLDYKDFRAAHNWLRAGDISNAIESFEKAIQYWRGQDGSYDLHGDPKPGNSDADFLEKIVNELKKLRPDQIEAARKIFEYK